MNKNLDSKQVERSSKGDFNGQGTYTYTDGTGYVEEIIIKMDMVKKHFQTD